jgi:hypothetical protein
VSIPDLVSIPDRFLLRCLCVIVLCKDVSDCVAAEKYRKLPFRKAIRAGMCLPASG